ncbi:MAG TPA: FtsX-like permease family protein [Luteimonas sp.]
MFRPTVAVLRIFLAGHVARPRDAMLMLAGFMIATATLGLLLAVPAGIDGIAARTGDDRIALVLSAQARSEVESRLPAGTAGLVAALPQVARDASGRALVAPQFIANTKLTRADGMRSTVQLRGVDDSTWALLATVDAVPAGVAPPGVRELLVGAMAAPAYRELQDDAPTLLLRQSSLALRHGLVAGGGLWESELWADLATLQAAFNAPGQVSALWIRLTDAAAFEAFAAAVRADPRLAGLRVVPQDAYHANQVAFVSHLVRVAAAGIALLLGAGAALVIANALDTALRRRRRETGTLRALGFPAPAIALAVLLEVAAIGLLATALALAAMVLLVDGHAFGTSAGSLAVQAPLAITPALALTVGGYSLALGLASALLPTWRLAGSRLIDSLRCE